MSLVDVVTMLALVQYLFFAAIVGRARARYGIRAPAVSGDERFERIHRVQMNTLELLVVLIPASYVAAKYWPDAAVAAAVGVYLVGRLLYWRAYVGAPDRRGPGFVLSVVPAFGLAIAALGAALPAAARA